MKIVFIVFALHLVGILRNLKDLPNHSTSKQKVMNHHNTKDIDNTTILITMKRISLKNFKHKICKYRQKHLVLLILLAGDIESNPGPSQIH